MQYMCLIYDDESRTDPPEVEEERMKEYFAFTQAVRDAGAFVDGAPLEATTTATTVQVRQGERTSTDGPFAETKEALLGYYLLECADLDEAVTWAAQIPAAHTGSVEVRPVMSIG